MKSYCIRDGYYDLPLPLYHSTVLLIPSPKSILAVNPNSRSARRVSRHRRGWPSGLVASHLIAPVYPVSRAIRSTRSRISISFPEPILTGSGLLYRSVAMTIPRAASSAYMNSRDADPVPQTSTTSDPSRSASTNFLMRAGITCELSGLKLSRGP